MIEQQKENHARTGEYETVKETPKNAKTAICRECGHQHWDKLCGTFIKLNEKGTKFSFCPCYDR